MDWSNAAPHILEKVMFYAAQGEKQRDVQERGITMARHTWLLTIEKFCRVSTHWKNVAFSSKILFPKHESIDFDNENERLGDEAKILLKAGFLSVVKRLRIDNSEAFKYITNVTKTSLLSFEIVTFRRSYADYRMFFSPPDIKWTGEDIRSMMDILP